MEEEADEEVLVVREKEADADEEGDVGAGSGTSIPSGAGGVGGTGSGEGAEGVDGGGASGAEKAGGVEKGTGAGVVSWPLGLEEAGIEGWAPASPPAASVGTGKAASRFPSSFSSSPPLLSCSPSP